jgi:2-dehydro-3-deoxyphosphogluconate aldolase/(4S)-4-hydroxy-2-oxoglutarate aldolase
MEKSDVVSLIEKTGIVAIIRNIDGENLSKVAEALYNGGVRAVEITCNTAGYLEMLTALQADWSDKLVIGAGTVLTPAVARQVFQAGAQFILAPNLDKEVISVAHQHDKLAVPGVATPTEVVEASKLGLDVVKLFPAAALGAQYLKDLRGPLGHIRYMPVGGISKDNMLDFLKAGAFAFGFGGELVDAKTAAAKNFAEIERRSRQLTTAFTSFRQNRP